MFSAPLEYDESYFIGNRTDASLLDWISSKGVSYNCYVQCTSGLQEKDYYNGKIDKVRVIVNAIQAPLSFSFFYWTLLVFILHKFNFRKPVMKIILGHFIVRCTGDIFDELGGLFSLYYCMKKGENGDTYCECSANTLNPMRWYLCRYFGTLFWYIGEIIADWYPLLRTRAVVKTKSIYIVYATCALFNLSKLVLIILHWNLDPRDLYDLKTGVFLKNKIDDFYQIYWIVQLIIIYASVIYEFTVYLVLKSSVFKKGKYDYGFLKKFKSLSEYRILIASFLSFSFLPLVSVAIILKFYWIIEKKLDLEFEFEKLRKAIANIQYYMIFIDQILLITSNYESILANNNILDYKGYIKGGSLNNNVSNATNIDGHLKDISHKGTFTYGVSNSSKHTSYIQRNASTSEKYNINNNIYINNNNNNSNNNRLNSLEKYNDIIYNNNNSFINRNTSEKYNISQIPYNNNNSNNNNNYNNNNNNNNSIKNNNNALWKSLIGEESFGMNTNMNEIDDNNHQYNYTANIINDDNNNSNNYRRKKYMSTSNKYFALLSDENMKNKK